MIYFPDTPDEFVNTKINCNSWVATAIIGSAALGAATKSFAANQAANAQGAGAARASETLKEAALRGHVNLEDYYRRGMEALSPYQQLGRTGIDEITRQLPALTTPIGIPQEMLDLQAPIKIDQATLESLPGYEFALKQGTKAAHNSAAARGLGVSGAALKGATTFAKGLADSTWADYFGAEMANRDKAYGRYATTTQLRQQQQGSAFDRLKGLVDTGAGASGAAASLASKTGSEITKGYLDAGKGVAGNTIGAANADAAAINATGDAAAKAFSDIGGYMAYQGLYGPKSVAQPSMEFTKGIAGDQYVPTYR